MVVPKFSLFWYLLFIFLCFNVHGMVTFVLTLILSNVTKLFQVIHTAFFVRRMHGLYECLDLFFFAHGIWMLRLLSLMLRFIFSRVCTHVCLDLFCPIWWQDIRWVHSCRLFCSANVYGLLIWMLRFIYFFSRTGYARLDFFQAHGLLVYFFQAQGIWMLRYFLGWRFTDINAYIFLLILMLIFFSGYCDMFAYIYFGAYIFSGYCDMCA